MIPRLSRVRLLLLLLLATAAPRLPAAVLLSEIQYHPVEDAVFNPDGTPALDLSTDVHEFVELHNTGAEAVDLGGWQLTGGIAFTFPAGARIDGGGHLVVAKDPRRLAAVPQYQLDPARLLGPYSGQLGNQGDSLKLRDASGATRDAVAYSASFPWAIGADALGADEEWTGLKDADHRHRGRSLERVSYAHPADDPANWLASPVAVGPSPGRTNAVRRDVPLPVVTRMAVYQEADEQRLIRKDQPARVDITFSANNELGEVLLEYFVDDVNATTEPVQSVPMIRTADPSGTRFTGRVPGLPDRSVVRYRVVATRAGVRDAVSPRPDDPFRWHAYFVTPARTSSKPIYDCFISTASLSRLAANISASPKRVTLPDPPGIPRASWNATEPAVFVHDGVVRDIRMRYHGSRYNRSPGRSSFKWSFPRYNRFQGTDALFETDKGNDFVVGHGLFIEAGLPVSSVRYVDLYLNQNGVLQRLEQGEFNGDLLDAYHRARQRLEPGSALEPSGEFYKCVGTIEVGGEGPYGRGDGRRLSKPAWTDLQMYEWTYAIQSQSWRGHVPFRQMIDGLWVARGDTPSAPNAGARIEALRAYFTNHWDIDTTLTYLAVENWACPWDDTTQNHFLWRRANGKWSMLPWDCDAWFGRGDNTPATSSIFIGEVGDPNNNFRGPNFFKDAFLKAFRSEYKRRLYELNNTLLNPTNITAMGFGSIRAFADARFVAVNNQCGFGPYRRPATPSNLLPAAGGSVVAGARLQATAYGHADAPPPAHARTLWEIRTADGSYRAPVLRLSSTNDLTTLPVPTRDLALGATYLWRCTYFDVQGHPSLPSTETSFVYGGLPGGRTNEVALVSLDAATTWRYEQSGADLGTAWKEPGFDDSAWPSGPALLALETAALPEPIRTPLVLGPTTFYFRHAFHHDGPTNAVLSLRTVLDDAAVLYLNGREIWRNRVGGSPPAYNTLADANVGDAVYEGPFEVAVDRLVPGRNVLAAEVHQSATTSSDVVFGLSLTRRVVTAAGQDLLINEVLADNRGAVRNGRSSPDYVEILNPTDRALPLAGYSLSDSIQRPDKYVFPAGVVIPPGGLLVVWCDAGSREAGLHTGFGLDASGQTLALFAPSTNGPALLDVVTFGLQAPDLPIGRDPSDPSAWTLVDPSPGAANRTRAVASAAAARINEWMAAPRSGDDWFELHNPGAQPAALGGCLLSGDPSAPDQSPIPPLSFIAAGGHALFHADGNPGRGADHVGFKLSAGGDFIGLSSSNRVQIDAVTFGPQAVGVSQGRLPDGAARIVAFPSSPTPGADNYLPHPAVVVNEVLARSTPPQEDAVELLNLSPAPVDLGGWYLSDDPGRPRKYRLPAGTVLPALGLRVVYESQFNADTNAPTSFALDGTRGDDVVLSSVDADGRPDGYRAVASFGPSEDGVPFGRVLTGSGVELAPLARTSFGADDATTSEAFRRGTGLPNAAPRVGPLVFSEVHYHPPDLPTGSATVDDTLREFVELRNISQAPLRLDDAGHPTNTYRIRGGIELDLPPGLTLPAGGHLVLVNFDPGTNAAAVAAFRSSFPGSVGAPLVGPYQGKLDNGGDTLELLRPEPPLPEGDPDAGYIPYVRVDRLAFRDSSPWPPAADGQGASLHRVSLTTFGDTPGNWTAAAPNPGVADASSPTDDSDQDGLPDAWERLYGLDPSDRADAARDADGDGLSNLQEYVAGTDPTRAASGLRIEAIRDAGGGALLLVFEAVAGKTYQREYRNTDGSGGWLPVGPLLTPGASGSVVLSEAIQPGLPGRYYRLRVQ